jgi:hypothetical protein
MRSTLTRVLASTAVAAVAATMVLTAAGTAGATTLVKTHTTLSIVAEKSTITAGHWDAVGGTLNAGPASVDKKVVELYRYSAKLKKWEPAQVGLTSKTGWVKFAVKPLFTSRYELVFHGTTKLAASHSGVVTIVVKPFVKTVTTLYIAATPTAIKAGGTTKISGLLVAGTKALADRLVYLYRWSASSKKWISLAVQLTGKKGGVLFVRKPSVTSTYELAFFGSPTLAATHSGAVTVTVS